MCQVLGGGMRGTNLLIFQILDDLFAPEFDSNLNSLSVAEEIKELWAEYENNSSLEANLVKDFENMSGLVTNLF